MSNAHKFPPLGLTYFWFLNDYCDDKIVDRQIEEFSKARISTVCLHPRDGLLLPYGSSDWFDFIRKTAKKLTAKGIKIWLYDEDPFPSGNAGGRIVLDHPEFIAHKITMYQASSNEIKEDGLWCFPAKGKLLFCALLSEGNSELVSDNTDHVGIVRRTWTMMKNWDSKWYYPATPLYISDRATANTPEYAIKIGSIPKSQILVAFTIEAVPNSKWNFLADPLNPKATKKFIEYTHEKYLQSVGDMFGKEITAIFTDEAKYCGETPWTPGIFEDFLKKYGYDLRPRLFDLFSNLETPESIRTKLNYREWCGRRFEQAWLKPVSAWCRKHNLKLVGHMSPEEDPVSQSKTLSNLMPLQKHLSLAGFDLIVPAVGDNKHPLLNIGILSAVSSGQQHKMAGVMSESLACSGKDFTIEKVRRILNWQTVMGMTTPVVHGIFHSLREEREFECPPDFGPESKFRNGLMQLSQDLEPFQEMLLGATQIAPVAILWPIKSFQLLNKFWQAEPGGLREELTCLVMSCLEAHVGIQLLDEADFQNAKMKNGTLRIGNASYSHVIVPGSTIWRKNTWDLLEKHSQENIHVYQYGTRPRYFETATGIEKNKCVSFNELTKAMIKNDMPKLMDLKSSNSKDVRITGWTKNGKKFHLLCYLGEGSIEEEIDNKKQELSGQKITAISMC
ncbi:MAG: glycosyl hydrolase [Victivallales bacterium]